MRGRKKNMPVDDLVVRLVGLMAEAGWSQALLAEKLHVSGATVTRVIASRAASSGFIARAERLLEEKTREDGVSTTARGSGATLDGGFHILQEMYRLLIQVNSRVEALAAESRVAGRLEKEVK